MRAKKALSQALEFHFYVENESVEDILAEGGEIVVLEFLQPFENIESVAAALSAFVKDGSDLLFQILSAASNTFSGTAPALDSSVTV